MEHFDQITNLTIGFIALASLVVSIIALQIAKRVLLFTSREFVPDISCTIDENDVVHLLNKSKKLFTIQTVGYLKISKMGFEDKVRKAMVQIPFVTNSRMRGDWQGAAKITISEKNAHACAHLCPYNKDMVQRVSERIHAMGVNSLDSCYPLPSLQSVLYLVEIVYTNRFQDTKVLLIKKQHVHGSGYHQTTITNEEFVEILNRSNIPKFDEVEAMWEYLIERYSTAFADVFKRPI